MLALFFLFEDIKMPKINIYQRELYHHGILNQKWGRRNGPPYPLDREDHSKAEKKTLTKSLSGKRHEEMYDRKTKSNPSQNKVREKKDFHLTDQQKKYIKIGASVAAAALVAYGGYRLASSPTARKLAYKGVNKLTKSPSVEDMIKNSGPEIVKKPKSPVKLVNPQGFKDNCKEVSEANVKRWLGVDSNAVAGARSVNGNLHDFINARQYNKNGIKWINETGGISPDPSGDSAGRVTKQILKHFKEGDCGYIGVTWDKKYLAPNSKVTAHAFNWRIVNGEAIFPDDQSTLRPLANATEHFKFIDPNKEIEIVQIMKEAFAK